LYNTPQVEDNKVGYAGLYIAHVHVGLTNFKNLTKAQEAITRWTPLKRIVQ